MQLIEPACHSLYQTAEARLLVSAVHRSASFLLISIR